MFIRVHITVQLAVNHSGILAEEGERKRLFICVVVKRYILTSRGTRSTVGLDCQEGHYMMSIVMDTFDLYSGGLFSLSCSFSLSGDGKNKKV